MPPGYAKSKGIASIDEDMMRLSSACTVTEVRPPPVVATVAPVKAIRLPPSELACTPIAPVLIAATIASASSADVIPLLKMIPMLPGATPSPTAVSSNSKTAVWPPTTVIVWPSIVSAPVPVTFSVVPTAWAVEKLEPWSMALAVISGATGISSVLPIRSRNGPVPTRLSRSSANTNTARSIAGSYRIVRG